MPLPCAQHDKALQRNTQEHTDLLVHVNDARTHSQVRIGCGYCHGLTPMALANQQRSVDTSRFLLWFSFCVGALAYSYGIRPGSSSSGTTWTLLRKATASAIIAS